MRHSIIILIIGIAFYLPLFAENPQDCRDAITVCQTTYETQLAYEGDGDVPDEINKDNSCLNWGELNSVWYVVNVKSSGDLGFLLTPKVESDDYDWAVYNLTNAECEDIKHADSAHLEVSCNYYQVRKNNPLFEGKTGPNGDTELSHQDITAESPFNALIPVLAGETYVVIISNYSYQNSQYGYKIDFGISTASIYDDVQPEIVSAKMLLGGGTKIDIRFSENIKCSTVDPGDFKVTGPGGQYNVISASSENCNNNGKYDRNYTLEVDNITESGIYTVEIIGEVTDMCENAINLGEKVDFEVDAFIANLESDKMEICAGETVQLNANHNGKAPFTYEWTNASLLSCDDCADPEAGPLDETTVFHVKVTDGNSHEAESDISIKVNPLPDIQVINGGGEICKGNSKNLEISVSNIENPAYSWEPKAGLSATDIANPVATPDVTTTYRATANDPSTNCESSVDIKIEVRPELKPQITYKGSSEDGGICPGEEEELDAGDKDANSGSDLTSYQWYKDGTLLSGETNRLLIISAAGDYSVEAENDIDCLGYDTIKISAYPQPEVEIEMSGVVCLGDVKELKAKLKTSREVDYLWLNDEFFIDATNIANPRINPDETGTVEYIVMATDKASGCAGYDTLIVNVLPAVTVDLGPDKDYCPGHDLLVAANTEGGAPEYTYTWEPDTFIDFPNPADQSTANLSPESTTTYKVTAEDANGCVDEDEIEITVADPIITLAIPELKGDPRTSGYSVPIQIVEESGLFACKPEYAKLTFKWDIALFNPQKAIANGSEVEFKKTFNNGFWDIEITIPPELLSSSAENLVEIIGDVMLGDKTSMELGFGTVEWTGVIAETSLNDGSLTLINVCDKAGLRLLKLTNAPKIMSVKPNPSSDNVKIDIQLDGGSAKCSIKIADMVGRIVYSDSFSVSSGAPGTIKEIQFPVNTLKSGLYKILLSDGINTVSEQLIIMR